MIVVKILDDKALLFVHIYKELLNGWITVSKKVKISSILGRGAKEQYHVKSIPVGIRMGLI